jgi:hypothetical protein
MRIYTYSTDHKYVCKYEMINQTAQWHGMNTFEIENTRGWSRRNYSSRKAFNFTLSNSKNSLMSAVLISVFVGFPKRFPTGRLIILLDNIITLSISHNFPSPSLLLRANQEILKCGYFPSYERLVLQLTCHPNSLIVFFHCFARI